MPFMVHYLYLGGVMILELLLVGQELLLAIELTKILGLKLTMLSPLPLSLLLLVGKFGKLLLLSGLYL